MCSSMHQQEWVHCRGTCNRCKAPKPGGGGGAGAGRGGGGRGRGRDSAGPPGGGRGSTAAAPQGPPGKQLAFICLVLAAYYDLKVLHWLIP